MARSQALVAGILLCGCGAKTGLLFEVSEDEPDASDAAADLDDDAGTDAATSADAGHACEIAPVAPPTVADDPLSSIWIANSGEATVSRLDTRTGAEIGRYRTGESDLSDPSRTSVDLTGAVYVGNRVFYGAIQSSITKIAGRLEDCVDADGDGAIETSTGSVALPWGEDECVLWSTPFGDVGCLLRAVAVDVTETDEGLRTVVYGGCWQSHRIYQLDADTGEVLQDFGTGFVQPYGFAVTAQGTMFVASGVNMPEDPHHVGVVDLTTTPPDVREAELPACGGQSQFGLGFEHISYGIAADREGRLWTCNLNGCLHRFDPEIREWRTAPSAACRGVAVGPDGSIWTGQESTLERWDPDRMEVIQTIPTSGSGGIGVAIDFDGKVWFVNQTSADASRLDPETGVEEGRFPVGLAPYTYSDMTGIQLRTNLGVYWQLTHVFELCDDAVRWLAVDLQADLTLGSGVRVRMRGAAEEASLPGQPWVDAEGIWSPETPSTAVPAELEGERFLEVELTAARGADGRWPTLRSVGARVR